MTDPRFSAWSHITPGPTGPIAGFGSTAIRADPTFAAAHWDLGAALVEQGSPERAAEGHAALGEALRLEPTFLTAAARPLFAEISQSLATLAES